MIFYVDLICNAMLLIIIKKLNMYRKILINFYQTIFIRKIMNLTFIKDDNFFIDKCFKYYYVN